MKITEDQMSRLRECNQVTFWKIDTVNSVTVTISMANLQHEGEQVTGKDGFNVVEVSLCGYSDYSGSAVERANYKAFEGLPEAVTTYGGSGSKGILVKVDEMTEETLEMILGLEDYPVVDDEAMYFLEDEIHQEAWKDWQARDLADIVVRCVLPVHQEETEERAHDWLLENGYELIQNKGQGDFIIEEGGNSWVRVEDVFLKYGAEIMAGLGYVQVPGLFRRNRSLYSWKTVSFPIFQKSVIFEIVEMCA